LTKIILIYIFISICTFAKGQSNIFVDNPFFGLASRDAEVKEIDSLNQVPNRIQLVVRQLFDSSLTDFVNNIFFIRGQILDLDKYYLTDSTPQVKYQFIMPKYELYFELRDTSINIKSYCIELSLDQYGQITRFEWPRENYNKRSEFARGNALKKIAENYAKSKHYKIKTCVYDLMFDESSQTIQWQFSFLQKSEGNIIAHSEKYKTIAIDIKLKKVIGESETISTSISCGTD
jgi:hypothetical protein